MRIVVALGGNALLKRGETPDVETQRRNVRAAVASVVELLPGNEVIITHGNGPQIGLLALQTASLTGSEALPLDVLGAQTDGMIGYWLERELDNVLGSPRAVTLLTQVEVDRNDPAFQSPSKFIGPLYDATEAERLAAAKRWAIARDGTRWRRVVASPAPKGVPQLAAIERLISANFIVICAGGGGIPVARAEGNVWQGVDAVVDKDMTSALLAEKLSADCLLLLTDVPALFVEWGRPGQRAVRAAHPEALKALPFPAGSMGPKVAAACRFAASPGRQAFIGSLESAAEILERRAGTFIGTSNEGIELGD